MVRIMSYQRHISSFVRTLSGGYWLKTYFWVEKSPISAEKLANSSINATARTVYYLNDLWRKEHFGTVADPSQKLMSKLEYYKDQEGTLFIDIAYQLQVVSLIFIGTHITILSEKL